MNNGTYTFEVCANSVASCLAAQEGGAQRVELCAGIPEGGTTPSYGEITMARRLLDIRLHVIIRPRTTPSYGEITMARRLLDIRLHVIIRPRGGDFLYSPVEIETMIEDIRMARRAGADGLVFGCLRENGDIARASSPPLPKARPSSTTCKPTPQGASSSWQDAA